MFNHRRSVRSTIYNHSIGHDAARMTPFTSFNVMTFTRNWQHSTTKIIAVGSFKKECSTEPAVTSPDHKLKRQQYPPPFSWPVGLLLLQPTSAKRSPKDAPGYIDARGEL